MSVQLKIICRCINRRGLHLQLLPDLGYHIDMKTTTAKTYLTGAGVVTVAFFFWLFLYQLFVSSQATTNTASALFDRPVIKVSEDDTVQVNILLQAALENRIDNAKVTVTYDPSVLAYVNTPSHKEDNLSPVETTCARNNYKLTEVASITDDPNRGLLTISRNATQGNAASGMFCYGTLTFKLKAPVTGSNKVLSFSDIDKWNVTGVNGPITVKPADYNTTVTLTQ